MKPRVAPPSPEHLTFLSAYEPQIRDLALRARALVLEQAPDAMELIYDAYNAVASGYTFTGRPSDAFIHVAVYPKWVNLGFNRGSLLDDPKGMLQGTGRWVRHIRISKPEDLESAALRAFVKAAVAQGERPDLKLDTPATQGGSVVRAIYPKKRRPGKASSASTPI